MWTRVDEMGRITCTTPYEKYADEDMQNFDIFPEDFDFLKQNEYRIVNGELIHDPLPDPPEKQLAELRWKIKETNDVVLEAYEAMLMGTNLDDDAATNYAKVLLDRATWKQQIKELEAQIAEQNTGGEA